MRVSPATAEKIATFGLRLLLAALTIAYALTGTTDFDIWFHLRAGEEILASGIPYHDPFSASYFQRPWGDFEWLFQVVLALVNRLTGVVWLETAVLLPFLLLTLWLLTRLIGAVTGDQPHRPSLLLALSLVATILYFRGMARPQLAGWALLAGGLLLLFRAGQAATLGRRVRLLAGYALLMLVWVNAHGSFVVGLGMLGLHCLWLLLGRRLLNPVVELVLLPLLAVSATLLNPYGIGMYATVFAHQSSWETVAYIKEWMPLPILDMKLGPTDGRVAWLAAAFFGAVGLAAGVRRLPLTVVVLAPGFAWMSLRHLRFIDMFAIAAAVPLYAGLVRLSGPGRGPVARLLPAAVALYAAAGVVPTAIRSGLPGTLDSEHFPILSAEFIAAEIPPGNLYNRYSDGGYLIWRLHPDHPVFIDGRTVALYDDTFFWAVRTAGASRPFLGRLLDEHRVGAALVERSDFECRALAANAGWSPVFLTHRRALFIRRDETVRSLTARFSPDGFNPCGSALEFVQLVEGKLDEPTRAMLDRLYAASGEMLAVVPENPELLLMRALIETFAHGRPEAALASLDLVPDKYRLGFYGIARGVALKTAGQLDEAAAAFGRAADEGNLYGLYHLGRLHFDRGQWDAAFMVLSDCFRKMRDGLPDDGYYLLGHAAYETGRFGQAVDFYRRAATIEPHNGTLWYNLGNALLATGDRSGALVAYLRAIALDPANWDAFYNASAVMAALGQPQRAATLLAHAAGRMPPDRPDEARAFRHKADEYRTVGR